MKKIPLTQGQFALVDDEDFELVNKIKWYASFNWNKTGFYAKGWMNGKKLYMHRYILNTPTRLYTDHINHNGIDNRKSNLRICDNQKNQANRQTHIKKTSIYKGVCWNKSLGKWVSGIKYNYKHYKRSSHTTEVEAAKAYDKKAKELFGEFANLNFNSKI